MTETPQLETAATESVIDQVAAMPIPPLVKINKSLDIASVHSARTPDDPHRDIFFFQDGLPYNSQGALLWEHPLVKASETLTFKAERLLRRALKQPDPKPGETDEPEPQDYEEEDEPLTLIDMAKWAAGNKIIPWQEVSNFLARKYSVRVLNKKQALELLIDQSVIPIGALPKGNRKLVESE